MGMYTGISFRLKVRKNAPLPVLEFMDKFFIEGETLQAVKDLQKESGIQFQSKAIALQGDQFHYDEIEDMSMMVHGHSSSFKSWYWHVKEDNGDYWLYETRASTKRPHSDLATSLIQALLPCLVIEEGDVVMRSIYEESECERVLALVNGKIVEEKGYQYGDWDSDNPNMEVASIEYTTGNFGAISHIRVTEEEEFTPPWTLQELRAGEEKARLEKEAEHDRIRAEGGGFGFGGW